MTIAATTTKPNLPTPFPWFGGKSRVASIVWDRFGDVKNYVEPFFGSGAVLLGRPSDPKIETINDADGFVCNFWRAVQTDPEKVAHYCDWPVNENDLTARHIWLANQRETLTDRLCGDPDFFDPKIAGWWCWGLCAWIGGSWCSGDGPWESDGGLLVKKSRKAGVSRQVPHLSSNGQGVHRKRPHLGNNGQGVHRKLPHLNDNGRGVLDWFIALSSRLRRVRVCCGDWSRVVKPVVTTHHGLTGVFLDPPYAVEHRDDVYRIDSKEIAHSVREWAIANGDNPQLRIALCGYEGEHTMPDSWDCVAWKCHGGMSNQRRNGVNNNKYLERIWFSPHCLKDSSLC
ncbi:MAG: DNA adenine methylase [Proteobacteria bacterium]|nr:DNA adenine methylase [Pseudomonadota bacterium]